MELCGPTELYFTCITFIVQRDLRKCNLPKFRLKRTFQALPAKVPESRSLTRCAVRDDERVTLNPQGLIQIGNDVLNRFDPHGDAHQIVADAETRPMLRG